LIKERLRGLDLGFLRCDARFVGKRLKVNLPNSQHDEIVSVEECIVGRFHILPRGASGSDGFSVE